MAAILSTSRSNSTSKNKDKPDMHQQPTDTWIIGVSTSISSTSTRSSIEHTLEPIRMNPSTPEGLRPRKSIPEIREDIIGRCNTCNKTKSDFSHPESNVPSRNSFSYHGHVNYSLFQRQLERNDTDSRNNKSNENLYADSEVDNNYNYNYNSIMCEHKLDRKHVAVSPDLRIGGEAKTAVGALLFAMTESSGRKSDMKKKSYDSILPPRNWMNHHQYKEEKYLDDKYADNGHTVECGRHQKEEYDSQLTFYGSPSSVRFGRKSTMIYRNDEAENPQQNVRLIRGSYNNDRNSSRHEGTRTENLSPYNFRSIMTEEEEDIDDSMSEKKHAPRFPSLTNDNGGGLNISAISKSQYQRDVSLADSLEDECNEYSEIPFFHQAFVNKNDMNERRMKENLLRSVFERLQDNSDLLYEFLNIRTSLFLGLREKMDTKCFRILEDLLFDLSEKNTYNTQRQSIIFCLSLIQNKNPAPDNTNPLSTYLSNYFWKPLPGFRSALGLEEGPQSPQTVRGGDTSLFSLPSDSANDSTPHTSNVSMATTITTVVSPENETVNFFKNQYHAFSGRNYDDIDWIGVRKTITILLNLIQGLETSCLTLDSNMSTAKKLVVVDNIERVFLELLAVPTRDLKLIINSFEMESNYCQFPSPENNQTGQTNEGENSDQREEHRTKSKETLRVNIVQFDESENSLEKIQSIECDLLSPTSNDISIMEESETAMRHTNQTDARYGEEQVDDLRRTSGSFDRDDDIEQREAAPLEIVDSNDHESALPGGTQNVAVVQRRSRRGHTWKRRFFALKNRARQISSE